MFFHRNKALFSVAAAHFVVDYAAALPNMMYPFLLISLGLDYGDIGVAAATFTLANAVAQPLFGYVGDRFQHRYVAAVGIIMQAVFIGSLAYANSFTSLVLLLALAGIFTGMFHPVGAAVANRTARRLKGASVGTFFIGGNLGFAVSPFIAARVFEEIGLIYAVFMIAPAVIISFAVLKFAVVLPPRVDSIDVSTPVELPERMEFRDLSVLIWVIFFRSYAFASFGAFIPLFLKANGFSFQVTGLVLTLFMSGFAVGILVGGTLSDRIGIKPVTVISLALVGPLALFFSYAPGSLLALLAMALAGFFLAGSFTPTIVVIQERLPRLLGVATGVVLGFTFASGAVGQWVTGRLADGAGLEAAFMLIAVTPMLGAIGATLMPGSVWPRVLEEGRPVGTKSCTK